MKKKVFCAGTLTLWFLLFCTFLSLRVEEMMIPRVAAVTPAKPMDSMKEALSLDCLSRNEAGEICLYTLYEGSGWEGGWRVGLASPEQYEIDLERRRISLQMGGRFIACAAKPPLPGEEARIVTETEAAEDLWLALCPEGWEEERQPAEGLSVQARAEGLLLVAAPETPQPFMEDQARAQLFGSSVLDPDPGAVYSLNDVESFLGQILLLSGLGALILFAVILWAGSCRLLKKPKKYKLPLLLNGVLFLLSIIALPLLLNAVDLPQSLLPASVIVDIAHYQSEFGDVFSALRLLAGEGSQTAQDLLSRAGVLPFLSAAILFAGVVAACALLFAAVVLAERSVPPGKHAAHTKR